MKRRADPSGTRDARRRSSVFAVAITALAALVTPGAPPAAATGTVMPGADAMTQVPVDARKAAVASHLRHLYAVYFAIRACAEMSAAQADRSLTSEVSLDEARRTLKLIDAASAEVGVDAGEVWTAVAPLASVTAEALKANPSELLARCHALGALFRTNVANLQVNLRLLGAKTLLIPKDY